MLKLQSTEYMQLVGGKFKSLEVLLLCFAFFLIKVTRGRAQYLQEYISIIGTVFCRTATSLLPARFATSAVQLAIVCFFIRVPTM